MPRQFASTTWLCLFASGILLISLTFGCGPASQADKNQNSTDNTAPQHPKSSQKSKTLSDKKKPRKRPAPQKNTQQPATAKQKPPPLQSPKKPSPQKIPSQPTKLNYAALEKAGIRLINGKHLTLYTDLPPNPAVDDLPAIFDQAFPQWCDYFGLDPAEHDTWHITGFLIKDKNLFHRLKLMPVGNPPFLHGYSQGDRLWLYDQKSDYYRRHLLLHEGTHSFMDMMLGNCGPPWYMEGMAELLGTHKWKDGKLLLNYFPAAKEEAPLWNRPKIISNAVAAGRERSFKQVLAYGPTAHLENEPYGWCWTAAVLLDRHPRYREPFRRLYKNVLNTDFNGSFRRLIGDDWTDLQAQWQAFVADLEFGHDVARTDIRLHPSEPLPSSGKTVRIVADRGWQSTRIELKAGQKYKITAAGRYQLADKPKIWWCEPGGVTIRYYRGRPLGILMGVVYPIQPNKGQPDKGQPDDTQNPFEKPFTIGLTKTITPRKNGVLLLKINESSAELHDNAGHIDLKIQPAKDALTN